MFPAGIPRLRNPLENPLQNPGQFSGGSFQPQPLLFEIGGGGGGGIGFPGGGGGGINFPGGNGTIAIGLPGNPASGSGGGSARSVGLGGSAPAVGYGLLSSVLGIPAINWGRIAAFLLGLILVAGGIYLIKPVQNAVNKTVKGAAVA